MGSGSDGPAAIAEPMSMVPPTLRVRGLPLLRSITLNSLAGVVGTGSANDDGAFVYSMATTFCGE